MSNGPHASLTASVRARNLAAETENRIHDDRVARTFGFAGGLVAGITTYAYLTRVPLERFGPDWLGAGSMAVRLQSPVYDGDDVLLEGEDAPDGGLALRARGRDGALCASGTAAATHDQVAPEPVDGPPPPPADERPAATRETLEAAGVLTARPRTFRAERAPEFLDAVDDPAEVYRAGVAHPGWVVYDANQVLAQNFVLGPWIHVSTEAHHFDTVGDGDVVTMAGRVAGLFEKRGHEFVELDLLAVARSGEAARPVARFRHTAIYRLAAP